MERSDTEGRAGGPPRRIRPTESEHDPIATEGYAASGRPPPVRRRQGLVLLAGSVVFGLLLGADGAAFYWTPLGIGLVYLAAAAAGGPTGGYWATAFVLCGWGAAVAYVRQAQPDLDLSGLYLAGAGLGASAAIVARRVGVRADALGATATIALSGGLLAVSDKWSALTDARTYALLVGAVGLVNVVWALVSDTADATPRPGRA